MFSQKRTSSGQGQGGQGQGGQGQGGQGQEQEQGQIDPVRLRRTVLHVIILVMAALALAWLFFTLLNVLLLLAFTAIFCYLVVPLVEFIERPLPWRKTKWHVPHTLAIVIVYLILLGGIVLALERVTPLLSDQFNSFYENAPRYARQIDQYLRYLGSLPSRFRLPVSMQQAVDENVTVLIEATIGWLQLIVQKVIRYLPWLVLIPVIGFFLLKDARSIRRILLTSFPEADMRYRVAMFITDVSETMAAYIRTQVLASVTVGVVVGIGLWLFGVPYPLLFAISAGLLEFIPVVGPLFLGIIATLVASFYSWRSALLVAGFLAVYRIIQDYLILPRLVSEGLKIHPVVVILAVLCGAELGGVIGVFLSVPVVALLLVCWRHWRDLQIERSSSHDHPEEPLIIEHALRKD
ncbi:MAG: AI-2E family transporter [Acidobacteria bacterium]|nr:AI-2E family transporter [Acidobacteriota bacterium]